MQTVSKSALETKRIAAKLAAKILRTKSLKHAKVVSLQGDLGAGKTTFVQGFVSACGVKEKAKSPTFLLIKIYKLEAANYKLLYHIDCYRIDNWKQLEPLEIRHILKDPHAIVLIEWPERIAKILPRKRIRVRLEHVDKNERKIVSPAM